MLASIFKAFPLDIGPPLSVGKLPDAEYVAPGNLTDDPAPGNCLLPLPGTGNELTFPTETGNGSFGDEYEFEEPGDGNGSFADEYEFREPEGNRELEGAENDPPKEVTDPFGEGNPEFEPKPDGTGKGSFTVGKGPPYDGGALNELVPVL